MRVLKRFSDGKKLIKHDDGKYYLHNEQYGVKISKREVASLL